MKRQLRDTVVYDRCVITQPMKLICYGGPYCGETRTVTPSECINDLVPVGDKWDTVCDIYSTAWRWTAKKGYTGIVLVWICH